MAGTTRVVGFWDVGQFIGQGLQGTVRENANPFSTVPCNGADRECPFLEQEIYLGIDFWREFGISPQMLSLGEITPEKDG